MRRAKLRAPEQGNNDRAWSVCSVLGILFVVCVTVVPAHAFTRTVCPPCFQTPISRATFGGGDGTEVGELEEVIVVPGTYVEEAGITVRGITLRSQSDNPDDTIIAFDFGSITADGRTAPAVIRGFTLDGGAVSGQGGEVTLRNLIIEGSTGPGVVGTANPENFANTEFTIIDSIIRHNKGGIQGGTGSVTLLNSEVSDNTAAGVSVSGGLLHITDSVISGNTAIGGVPKGGGIDASGTIILENVTVENNTAPASNRAGNPSLGGGMMIRSNRGETPATVTIRGGIFRGNSAERGGGIYVDLGGLVPTSVFDGVTVTSNTALDSGGGIFCDDRLGPIELLLAGDVSGNSPDDVVGCQVTPDIRWNVTGWMLDLVVCKNKTIGQKVRSLSSVFGVPPSGSCKELGLIWGPGDIIQVKVVGFLEDVFEFGGVVAGIDATSLVCKNKSTDPIFKERIDDPPPDWDWGDPGAIGSRDDRIQCKAIGPARN